MSLPTWAHELNEPSLKCHRCGDTLEVATALGAYLGGNGSYYCDPKAQDAMHEPSKN